MIPTIIIASIIGMVFIAIVVNETVKRKKGKPSCSCGGNCGACGLCHFDNGKEDNSGEADGK